ncbi:tRNA pseudouridine synthase A [Buchnera aphidicola (Cinara kochiana kochiana)]|uniref:tRNA pseudouridine synthase A n=1 Tax=Buchnera aphidicola (Cinara kochiana kochiana) TaxID=2518976 RepID=A0A451D5I9_9GAMM|nr:tRNA pseudouridine(38-40) synthase TruA [Buchnera aphidicola]VFP81053.1 tRNA pseudouridine synthase A [Buchnera aphidicola (Cinara kochiana kochiana)]
MKFVFGLEYDGSIYFGWQKQRLNLTIQGYLEQALSKIADYKIDIVCAGRTDRGVHAIMQIAHFSTHVVRHTTIWLNGMNALLPSDITVLWLQEISSDFNARFSALSRSYRYLILNREKRSSFLTNYYFHVRHILDIKNMKISSKWLIGQHDFTSFRSSGCQSFSPRRIILSLKIYRVCDFVVIDITANSFLYHMVRNIVGCLISVGLSKHKPIWVKQVLCSKNINKKYSTVPSKGLYFLSVTYPKHYGIPIKPHLFKYIDLF